MTSLAHVFGLGHGEHEVAVPPAPIGGRAFLPEAATALARALSVAGWEVRPLAAAAIDFGPRDLMFLVGAPEPIDPWLKVACQRVPDLVLHPAESLTVLAGPGARVVRADEEEALLAPQPTVVVGLPAPSRLPMLLPEASLLLVRAGKAPEPLEPPEVLSGFSVGDALVVPAHAVPSLRETARLLTVMARLRAPDGCPWDREQTHRSLRPYLLEEAAEAVDAIADGDPNRMREELGDLLLQVVFHGQIGLEEGAFTFEDVARGIADKLVRRHPHVFGEGTERSPEGLARQWHRLKREETVRPPSAEVPASLGALERAEKLLALLRRLGLPSDGVADPLWRMVSEATAEGRSLSLELRETVAEILRRLDALGDPEQLDAEGRRRAWQKGGV